MAKNKHRGIENLKSRYGFAFVLPWLIGYIVFFAIPLVQSLLFSFSDVSVEVGGIKTSFTGIAHYKYLINESPNYLSYLRKSVTTMTYSLPLIILVSMVLGLLLNQKFKGRLFFRSLYFLPVIIATGVVIEIIFTTTGDMNSSSTVESFTANMFSVEDIMNWLSLPDEIAEYVKTAINSIFDLIWNCGIQTVLVIAGLQSIPKSLYEASHVEGANKWEEFWFITFPMLSHVTLLVGVFTMVELFTDKRAKMVKEAYKLMTSGNYDETSAMLWFYLLVAGSIMLVILFVYQHFLMKRWE